MKEMKLDPEQDDRTPRGSPRPERNPRKPGPQGNPSTEHDTSRDPEEEGSAGRQPA